MGIESNLLTTIQEIYFDLEDLQQNNYLKGVKVEGFEEFKNMQQFIEEQISKLNYLENHYRKMLNLSVEGELL
jgi:hypothetical protein